MVSPVSHTLKINEIRHAVAADITREPAVQERTVPHTGPAGFPPSIESLYVLGESSL
jgi:hypothetical protein